jgi:hypothetical protein
VSLGDRQIEDLIWIYVVLSEHSFLLFRLPTGSEPYVRGGGETGGVVQPPRARSPATRPPSPPHP